MTDPRLVLFLRARCGATHAGIPGRQHHGRVVRRRPSLRVARPVAAPLSDARAAWRFRPDRRASADAGLWNRNLEISGAPFVVLMGGERLHPVERAWCESDPSHFLPVYLTPKCAVYRVTEP